MNARSASRWAGGRRLAWLGALAVTAAVIVAVLTTGAAARPSAKSKTLGTLTWATASSPAKLDIPGSFTVDTLTTLSPVLQTPLVLDDNGNLKPQLATSWKQLDPVTYVYQIRKGVKFSDGKTMTAEDVAFSMMRNTFKSLASQGVGYFQAVRWIRATGPYTVKVKLYKRDPAWQYIPAYPVSYVIEKSQFTANPTTFGTPSVLPVGTGPYAFKSFVPGDSVTLERNPGYWGQKPAADKIVFRQIVDPATLFLAMQSRQVDGTFDVPVGVASQWRRASGGNVRVSIATAGIRVALFSFDMTSPPWNDVHVRRAFAYALDRKGIVKSVYDGAATPATAVPPPEQWVNLASKPAIQNLYKQLPQYSFDLAKAKAELAKSAFPKGFTASLTYRSSKPDHGLIAQNLAQNLAEIGIKLNVSAVPSAQWRATFFAHKDLGIQMFDLGADYPDPSNNYVFILPSKYAVPNQFNVANVKSNTVDNLLDAQQNDTNPAKRVTDLYGLTKYVAEQVPYLPIVWKRDVMALGPNVGYKGTFTAWTWLQPFVSRIFAP
jgi:peptide/nickel transport system substrate-binding protein